MERSLSEDIEADKGGLKVPLLDASPSKGGLRTLPFILANEGLERAASYGLEPNMIVYLMVGYGLEMATGSNIIFLWSAAANFTPILCAFLSDSYVGRFRMIGFGSVLSLMGMMLLLSTTILPGARPSCDNKSTNKCTSPTPFQLILLCSSFALMSIGGGGIRSSTMAFGADQLVRIEEEKDATPSHGAFLLERFFNWYYFAVSFSILFALTCVVYIQDHMGWKAGFGVPVLLMVLSTLSFFLASSFYVKAKPKASFVTGFAQVLFASWRNRHYRFPREQNIEGVYYVAKGSTVLSPSENLRFLNKACFIKDATQELTPDGKAIDAWHLCTTEQVEELKSVINIIPLWSTGIMLGVSVNQTSFRVLQANSMDRHVLSSSFEIPAASFGTFALIIVILWLCLYDRVIIPLASKVMGKRVTLDVKTRMGIGFLLSFVSMVVAGVVESVRRGVKLPYYPPSTSMSALWLVPQVCLLGLAEALAAIAQIEFFYSEFPKSMSCIASNLYGLGIGVASLVSSFIVTLVDHFSKGGGKESWVSGDLNNAHYDYYYWLLGGLSLLNYMYFLLCSRAYGHSHKVLHDTKESSSDD